MQNHEENNDLQAWGRHGPRVSGNAQTCTKIAQMGVRKSESGGQQFNIRIEHVFLPPSNEMLEVMIHAPHSTSSQSISNKIRDLAPDLKMR